MPSLIGNLVEVTAPIAEPLTLEEVKNFLKMDTDDEDTTILSALRTAREDVEAYLQRQLMQATYDWYFDKFPSGGHLSGFYHIPRPPLVSVTTVKYYDTAGVLQTLAATEYEIDSTTEPAQLRLAYDKSWPQIRSQKNAIVVRYICGYGGAAADAQTQQKAIPNTIRWAMFLDIGQHFEERLPMDGARQSYFDLLNQNRILYVE